MAAKKITQMLCCVLYICICVISLFIIGPIGSSMSKHNGECLLYGKTSVGYGLLSTCNFCIAMAVIFCLCYGLAQAIVSVLVMIGILQNPFTELKLVIVSILEGIICMLMFITACIISVGFKTLCNSLTENYDGSCHEIYIRNPQRDSVDTTFYTTLMVAQAGGWIAFFLWMGKVVLNVLLLRAQDSLHLPCRPRSEKPKQDPAEMAKY